MADLTGMTLGPYRVIERIGRGGMATVYKAYHAAMDRYVAIKVLPEEFADIPGFRERFEREAKTVANLQHPHILPVFDYGQERDISFLVMPYIPTGTLKDYMAQEGALPLDIVARITNQLAEALDYAHHEGILHRDIKPGNVLFDQRGNPLLTDFGLTRMVEGGGSLTGSGVIGTPDYMSPEQGQGKRLDHRSDLYSLGIVIYEMVTGEVPFSADTPVAVIFKHVSASLPLPRSLRPDLSEAAENVILKALAKEPAQRWETCVDLATAFSRVIAGEPVSLESRTIQEPGKATVSGIQPVVPGPIPDKATEMLPGRSGLSKWVFALVGALLVMLVALFASGVLSPAEESAARATDNPQTVAAQLLTNTAIALETGLAPTATDTPDATQTIDAIMAAILATDAADQTATIDTFTDTPTATWTPTEIPAPTPTPLPSPTSTVTSTPTDIPTATLDTTATAQLLATQVAQETLVAELATVEQATLNAGATLVAARTATAYRATQNVDATMLAAEATVEQATQIAQLTANAPTNTPRPTMTPSDTATMTLTATTTPTVTASPTDTPTATDTATNTPTNTASPTNTPTLTTTATASATATATASRTATDDLTATAQMQVIQTATQVAQVTHVFETAVAAVQATSDAQETVDAQMAMTEAAQPSTTATPDTTAAPVFAGEILFHSERDGNVEIYSMDADGGNLQRLTGNIAIDSVPSWSPDQTQIAFQSDRDGNSEIYVMDADGDNTRRLTDNPALDQYATWSPDGSQILFHSSRDGNLAVFVMDADGSNQSRLTDITFNDSSAHWSRDGRQIVFVSDRDGSTQIYAMDSNGSNQRRLTNNTANEYWPHWSPDGSQIVFISGRDGNFEIYAMDADGSNQRRLTDNPADDAFATWSADGGQIVFHTDRDDNYEIYLMDADGGNLRRLTNEPGIDRFPSWGSFLSTDTTEAPTTEPTAVTATSETVELCTVQTTMTVNLRGGPGTNYDRVGQLSAAESTSPDGQVTGVDGYRWWRLGEDSWVRGDLVTSTGLCDSIPVVETPVPPTPAPAITPQTAYLNLNGPSACVPSVLAVGVQYTVGFGVGMPSIEAADASMAAGTSSITVNGVPLSISRYLNACPEDGAGGTCTPGNPGYGNNAIWTPTESGTYYFVGWGENGERTCTIVIP